jgi:hypothetical protein
MSSPKRAKKVKGMRNHQDRFAAVLTDLMNEMAVDGWEYQRADSLPCEEKSGFTRWVANFQTVLVFRRATPQVPNVVPVVEYVVELPPMAEPEPADADAQNENHEVTAKPSLPGFRRSNAPPVTPPPPNIEDDDEPPTPAG